MFRNVTESSVFIILLSVYGKVLLSSKKQTMTAPAVVKLKFCVISTLSRELTQICYFMDYLLFLRV